MTSVTLREETRSVAAHTERERQEALLREAGTSDPLRLVQLGIDAAKEQYFDRGLIYLGEAYLRMSRDGDAKIPAAAFSYYGLCLAMHKGRVKEAAEYCELALEKEFFNPEHYWNLGQVWLHARRRRKAVEAVDRGLAVDPLNTRLRLLRESIGLRRKPVLPFLHRDNPLNVSLGRFRKSLGQSPHRGR